MNLKSPTYGWGFFLFKGFAKVLVTSRHYFPSYSGQSIVFNSNKY
jgi:hypothetical protein